MDEIRTVGLVGIGNIGKHFATRLMAAGYEVTCFDVDLAAVMALQKAGAKTVDSIAELGASVETVLLSLPTPGIVKEVILGEDGLTSGGKVRLIVDLSTTGPAVTREIAGGLEGSAIEFVGAPVSGGTANAEQGKLAVMAAGPQAACERIRPILDVIGRNIFYLGEDPSLGQTVKIVNNTLYATTMIASCEALVYGVKAGLDPQTLLDVINVSSGRSFATLERIPQCALDGSFPLRFTTELLHKDVKMCIDDAERIGAPMQVNPVARQFLAFSMTQGGGRKDNVEVLRHIEEWAGVEVRSGPQSSEKKKEA